MVAVQLALCSTWYATQHRVCCSDEHHLYLISYTPVTRTIGACGGQVGTIYLVVLRLALPGHLREPCPVNSLLTTNGVVSGHNWDRNVQRSLLCCRLEGHKMAVRDFRLVGHDFDFANTHFEFYMFLSCLCCRPDLPWLCG